VTRTILVTGGAGFIGSTLVRHLVTQGDHVRVIDDLSIGSRLYLAGLEVELVTATLSDDTAVRRAVEGSAAVVHLAARAGVVDSISDPLGTFRANVVHTVRLLDHARLAGVDRFVFASSNAVIGEAEPPFDETMPVHPLTPYGASKLAGEAYCQAYAGAFGLAACALRFSNAYGPRSLHKKSVVAAWLRAAHDEQPILIHGDGRQTRDFIHVDDLARAIVAALAAPAEAVRGEVFQIGTGRETTVNELAETIQRVSERQVAVRHEAPRLGDASRNASRVDKAASRLGFRAVTSLAQGLHETARWFEAALDDPDLGRITPVAVSGSD
jgi:UDP-glucose 4-epimerase